MLPQGEGAVSESWRRDGEQGSNEESSTQTGGFRLTSSKGCTWAVSWMALSEGLDTCTFEAVSKEEYFKFCYNVFLLWGQARNHANIEKTLQL